MYYNIWELTSMKDTVKKFYAYWDAPVNTTYKIEHKLQKGEQLWFFMKDIKTGKEFDDCSVNPKIFVSKNEGDVISMHMMQHTPHIRLNLIKQIHQYEINFHGHGGGYSGTLSLHLLSILS